MTRPLIRTDKAYKVCKAGLSPTNPKKLSRKLLQQLLRNKNTIKH